MHQKAISSPGLEEAETSLKNQPEGEYVPMVCADGDKGEDCILQNPAVGKIEKGGSPDLHGTRPSMF